jgi:hypothetical protein
MIVQCKRSVTTFKYPDGKEELSEVSYHEMCRSEAAKADAASKAELM